MYLNIDINTICTPFLNGLAKNKNITEKSVASMIDIYKNTGVKHILFNIFGQYSAVDSDVFTTYADKFMQKEENGIEVDYKDFYVGIYTANKEYGIDPYDIWIKECKESGINPWISVRMNDCHHPDNEVSFLRSNFFYEAKEKNWMVGEKYGYFKNAFNYAVPEVRKKMLDYIEEQINRYDVYGIELDFMRDIFCFDYIDSDNSECVEIMNNFLREVKKITKSAEDKWGHKIKTAIRLNRDIDQSKIFGFDARSWEKESLADIIIPSPRWQCSDSLIPIEVWKQELPETTVLACVETLVGTRFGGDAVATAEIARGIAGGYLSRGADGIYLYNYFGEERCLKRDCEVYRTCSSLEEIVKHPIRYVVIGQEKTMAPYGTEPCTPFPMDVTGDEAEIVIATADITKGKTVSLIVGFLAGSPDTCDILFNGQVCTGFEKIDTPEPKYAMDPDTVCYRCKVKFAEGRKQKIGFRSQKATVSWIEIDVR